MMASGKKEKLKVKNNSRLPQYHGGGELPVPQKASNSAEQPAVPQRTAHLRAITATLKHDLKQCSEDPQVESVHHVRTGTRRLQATLETVLRELAPAREPGMTSDLERAADRWARLLKRIRRDAAPVRDLDVHREILEELVGRERLTAAGNPSGADPGIIPEEATAPPSPQPEEPSPIQLQAHDLDSWLKHARQQQAGHLARAASKVLPKFEARETEFEELLAESTPARRAVRSAAVVALESFVRLADAMQRLDAENLHDFRKGAKKARYIAESGSDAQATAVGKALKKLQDEIGEWHDWLVLADEARAALGDKATELVNLIDAQRDRHYVRAIGTTTRLRGKLMGEWLATQQRPRRPSTRRQPAKGVPQVKTSEKAGGKP